MHSLKTVLLVGLLANGFLLTACDFSATADDAPPRSSQSGLEASKKTEAAGQFDYELRTQEASALDDRFPFGYWEVTRIYPEVVSESHPLVADAVNQRIGALIDQYRCDGLGDQSFRTQEVYLDNSILSMAYEAMWMCASMPSPESESGSLNLDLTDGTEIRLEEQFRGPSDYAQFRNRAVRDLNRELDKQDDRTEERCPDVRTFDGYHTDGKDLIVSSLSGRDGNKVCDVSARFPLQTLEGKLRADSVLLLNKTQPGSGAEHE